MADNTPKPKLDTKQKREVPVSQDLVYTAMKMFPGYDQNTALTLYLIDQSEKQQKTDSEQTKLIQAQRSQNEKLTGAVKTIGQELDDLESQSQATDLELERLKDLSARLKPAGEVQKQEAQVSSEELQKLEQQLQAIKSQPGMNPEKFTALAKQVEELKSKKSVDSTDVEKIEKVLASLDAKGGVNNELYNRAMSQLEKTQKDLDAKEKEFKGSIEKTGRETASALKRYDDLINQYKEKLDTAKDDIKALDIQLNNVKQDELIKIRGEASERIQDIESQLSSFIIDQMKKLKADLTQQIKATSDTEPNLPGFEEPTNKEPEPKQAAAAPTQGSNVFSFQKGAQQAQKQAELSKRMTNVAKTISPALREPYRMTTNEATIKTARSYPEDRDFDYWLRMNLPYMVSMFKDTYWEILERKDPTYSDQQIAYVLEDYADWLWEEMKLKDLNDADVLRFFKASLGKLLQQPVEIDYQQEINMKEGLDKVYENMLDQIVNETLRKNR